MRVSITKKNCKPVEGEFIRVVEDDGKAYFEVEINGKRQLVCPGDVGAVKRTHSKRKANPEGTLTDGRRVWWQYEIKDNDQATLSELLGVPVVWVGFVKKTDPMYPGGYVQLDPRTMDRSKPVKWLGKSTEQVVANSRIAINERNADIFDGRLGDYLVEHPYILASLREALDKGRIENPGQPPRACMVQALRTMNADVRQIGLFGGGAGFESSDGPVKISIGDIAHPREHKLKSFKTWRDLLHYLRHNGATPAKESVALTGWNDAYRLNDGEYVLLQNSFMGLEPAQFELGYIEEALGFAPTFSAWKQYLEWLALVKDYAGKHITTRPHLQDAIAEALIEDLRLRDPNIDQVIESNRILRGLPLEENRIFRTPGELQAFMFDAMANAGRTSNPRAPGPYKIAIYKGDDYSLKSFKSMRDISRYLRRNGAKKAIGAMASGQNTSYELPGNESVLLTSADPKATRFDVLALDIIGEAAGLGSGGHSFGLQKMLEWNDRLRQYMSANLTMRPHLQDAVVMAMIDDTTQTDPNVDLIVESDRIIQSYPTQQNRILRTRADLDNYISDVMLTQGRRSNPRHYNPMMNQEALRSRLDEDREWLGYRDVKALERDLARVVRDMPANYQPSPALHHYQLGKLTEIIYPTTSGVETAPARYVLLEADELVTSHLPLRGGVGAENNPLYPDNLQERDYAADIQESEKVRRNAMNFMPGLVINDNPDAINGPPVIDENGLVLGGNSRGMTTKLVYALGLGEPLKEEIKAKAWAFGFVASDVDRYRQPIVARMVDIDARVDREMGRLWVRRFNVALTQAMSPAQSLTATAKGLTRQNWQEISEIMAANMGPDDTLFAYLSSPAALSLLRYFAANNVIPDRIRSAYFDDDGLNRYGKRFVQDLLVGHLFQFSPGYLADMQDREFEVFGTIAPYVIVSACCDPAWDVREDLIIGWHAASLALQIGRSIKDAMQPKASGDLFAMAGVHEERETPFVLARETIRRRFFFVLMYQHGRSSRYLRKGFVRYANKAKEQSGAQQGLALSGFDQVSSFEGLMWAFDAMFALFGTALPGTRKRDPDWSQEFILPSYDQLRVLPTEPGEGLTPKQRLYGELAHIGEKWVNADKSGSRDQAARLYDELQKKLDEINTTENPPALDLFAPRTENPKKAPFVPYPWSECIEDQTARYGADAAPRVCGTIRAQSRRHNPEASFLVPANKKQMSRISGTFEIENNRFTASTTTGPYDLLVSGPLADDAQHAGRLYRAASLLRLAQGNLGRDTYQAALDRLALFRNAGLFPATEYQKFVESIMPGVPQLEVAQDDERTPAEEARRSSQADQVYKDIDRARHLRDMGLITGDQFADFEGLGNSVALQATGKTAYDAQVNELTLMVDDWVQEAAETGTAKPEEAPQKISSTMVEAQRIAIANLERDVHDAINAGDIAEDDGYRMLGDIGAFSHYNEIEREDITGRLEAQRALLDAWKEEQARQRQTWGYIDPDKELSDLLTSWFGEPVPEYPEVEAARDAFRAIYDKYNIDLAQLQNVHRLYDDKALVLKPGATAQNIKTLESLMVANGMKPHLRPGQSGPGLVGVAGDEHNRAEINGELEELLKDGQRYYDQDLLEWDDLWTLRHEVTKIREDMANMVVGDAGFKQLQDAIDRQHDSIDAKAEIKKKEQSQSLAEMLLKGGGKEWERGTTRRIYLSAEQIEKALKQEKRGDPQTIQKMIKSKPYFGVNTHLMAAEEDFEIEDLIAIEKYYIALHGYKNTKKKEKTKGQKKKEKSELEAAVAIELDPITSLSIDDIREPVRNTVYARNMRKVRRFIQLSRYIAQTFAANPHLYDFPDCCIKQIRLMFPTMEASSGTQDDKQRFVKLAYTEKHEGYPGYYFSWKGEGNDIRGAAKDLYAEAEKWGNRGAKQLLLNIEAGSPYDVYNLGITLEKEIPKTPTGRRSKAQEQEDLRLDENLLLIAKRKELEHLKPGTAAQIQGLREISSRLRGGPSDIERIAANELVDKYAAYLDPWYYRAIVTDKKGQLIENLGSFGNLAEVQNRVLHHVKIRPLDKDTEIRVYGQDWVVKTYKPQDFIAEPPKTNMQELQEAKDKINELLDLIGTAAEMARVAPDGTEQKQALEYLITDHLSPAMEAWDQIEKSSDIGRMSTGPEWQAAVADYAAALKQFDRLLDRPKHQSKTTAPVAAAPAAKKKPEFAPGDEYRDDIPRHLAVSAHSGTSHSPDKRADQTIQEYIDTLLQVRTELEALAKTPEQKMIAAGAFERFREGLLKHWKAKLEADSRTMSSMITGPSNFPTRSNEKRMQVASKRLNDLVEYVKKAYRQAREDVAPSQAKVISSDAPDAVEQLQAKIDAAEKMQELYKAANKIAKSTKLKDDEKVKQLTAIEGISEKAAQALIQPDFAGRLGFAPYELTNNLANIKRMKGRVLDLERKQGDQTREGFFDDGFVVDNVENNRLQIFFDGKPKKETRDKLKKNGFRWSPTVGAWQRQRGNNAFVAMRQIIGDVKLHAPGEEPPEKEAPGEEGIEELLDVLNDIEGVEARDITDEVGELLQAQADEEAAELAEAAEEATLAQIAGTRPTLTKHQQEVWDLLNKYRQEKVILETGIDKGATGNAKGKRYTFATIGRVPDLLTTREQTIDSLVKKGYLEGIKGASIKTGYHSSAHQYRVIFDDQLEPDKDDLMPVAVEFEGLKRQDLPAPAPTPAITKSLDDYKLTDRQKNFLLTAKEGQPQTGDNSQSVRQLSDKGLIKQVGFTTPLKFEWKPEGEVVRSLLQDEAKEAAERAAFLRDCPYPPLAKQKAKKYTKAQWKKIGRFRSMDWDEAEIKKLELDVYNLVKERNRIFYTPSHLSSVWYGDRAYQHVDEANARMAREVENGATPTPALWCKHYQQLKKDLASFRKGLELLLNPAIYKLKDCDDVIEAFQPIQATKAYILGQLILKAMLAQKFGMTEGLEGEGVQRLLAGDSDCDGLATAADKAKAKKNQAEEALLDREINDVLALYPYIEEMKAKGYKWTTGNLTRILSGSPYTVAKSEKRPEVLEVQSKELLEPIYGPKAAEADQAASAFIWWVQLVHDAMEKQGNMTRGQLQATKHQAMKKAARGDEP